MHYDKSQPAADVRHRPYQGVRVKDPVKELLRRKRSARQDNSKTPAQSMEAQHFTSPTGLVSSELPAVLGEGWRALPWPPPDGCPQDPRAPGQCSTGPALSSGPDLYMQTLCPGYTMLTYTHAPLLTNFGTIPVAPVPAPLPPMDPDSGLTYLPWTAVSSPTALPGSSLLHVPLSMSLATMIPQLDVQASNGEAQILAPSVQPGTEGQRGHDGEAQERQETPSLLDKLLEEHKSENGESESSFSDSIFVSNVS